MNPGRRLLAIGFFVSGVLCFPPLARAHAPIEGIGTFYGYMLHVLAAPAHALLLLATTLMLGQQALAGARAGLAALAAAFGAGLAFSSVGLGSSTSEWQLLAGALATGSAVSLGLQLPIAAAVSAAAIAGLLIGLDSAPTEATAGERPLALAGLVSGTLGLALVVTGLTLGQTRRWQRIGVRIAGSWIVAVSILVLSLSLTGGAAVDKSSSQPVAGRMD